MCVAAVQRQVIDLLDGKADVVLSDMYPSVSGVHSMDHARAISLAETALEFSCRVLRPGGVFLVKLNQGGSEQEYRAELRRLFRSVSTAKPPASRAESSEFYLFAEGYQAAKDG